MKLKSVGQGEFKGCCKCGEYGEFKLEKHEMLFGKRNAPVITYICMKCALEEYPELMPKEDKPEEDNQLGLF